MSQPSTRGRPFFICKDCQRGWEELKKDTAFPRVHHEAGLGKLGALQCHDCWIAARASIGEDQRDNRKQELHTNFVCKECKKTYQELQESSPNKPVKLRRLFNNDQSGPVAYCQPCATKLYYQMKRNDQELMHRYLIFGGENKGANLFFTPQHAIIKDNHNVDPNFGPFPPLLRFEFYKNA